MSEQNSLQIQCIMLKLEEEVWVFPYILHLFLEGPVQEDIIMLLIKLVRRVGA